MSLLYSLPDEVLKLIMQHVPLQDRLGSCSLVCHKLCAAAAAATQQVVVGDRDNAISLQRAESVLGWLEHYGQHVTSLWLTRFPQPPEVQLQIRQLSCCPNLLDLYKVCGGHIQLGPTADGYPGVIEGCTKLTRLQLAGHIIDAPHGGPVDSMSRLVGLQHLDILPYYQDCVLPAAALPRLTRLTYLSLGGLSSEHLLQLGALTNLEDLVLCADDRAAAAGPCAVPGMVLPASLTSIWLKSRVEAGLLSLVPTGLRDLCLDCAVEGPIEGPGSWLAHVALMQQLTRLKVESYKVVWPPPGPAYLALTANSSLASLAIDEYLFPDGTWPHVFPTGRTLSHITCFELCRDKGTDGNPSAAFDATDLSCLVRCCPSIRTIKSINLLHGLHVSELHKLTALTRLVACYGDAPWEDCVESMTGLASVTRLRDLDLYFNSQSLTADVLLPLLSLTALTSLAGTCWDADGEFDEFCWLTSEVSACLYELANTGNHAYCVLG